MQCACELEPPPRATTEPLDKNSPAQLFLERGFSEIAEVAAGRWYSRLIDPAPLCSPPLASQDLNSSQPTPTTTHPCAPLSGIPPASSASLPAPWPTTTQGRPVRRPVGMPSRQERRKAERDAAKRAPAQAGAGGAAGAAAALANLNVDPLGDWTTQAEDPFVGPAYSLPLLARHVIYSSDEARV